MSKMQSRSQPPKSKTGPGRTSAVKQSRVGSTTITQHTYAPPKSTKSVMDDTQPYEVVKRQSMLATTMMMTTTMMNTWAGQTHVWWEKKDKKQRRMTLVQLCAIFTVIIVVLLTLIAVGALWLYASQYLRREVKIPTVIVAVGNLTTKTRICRSQINLPCVYEDIDYYHKCQIEDNAFCVDIRWMATFDGQSLSFAQQRTKWPIRTTEYSDCGVGRWCKGQNCTRKKGGWWRTYGDPLPRDDDPEPLAEVTPKENIEKHLPCLKFAPGSKEAVDRLIAFYTQGCNRSMCGNLQIDYAFRIQWYHCNLSIPDPITGMRQRTCTTLFKVLACHRCKPDDRWSSQSIDNPCNGPFMSTGTGDCLYRCRRNATKLFPQPDGTRCKPNDPDKICMAGICYEIHHQ